MPESPAQRRPARDPRDLVGTAVLVVLVGALVALQLAAVLAARPSAGLVVVDVAAALFGVALLPVLPRHPAGTTFVLALLAAGATTATPPATAGVFRTARSCRTRPALLVAAVSAVAHLARGLWRPVDGLAYGWYALLVVVVHAMLLGWGWYLRARQDLLDSLAERARRAEAEQDRRVAEARLAERTRIAREMHDVLGHRLTLVAAWAGALEYRPDTPPERIAEAAGVIRAGAHQAMAELRDVVSVLRDGPADPGADEPLRPQPTFADLPALVEESRAVGAVVRLDLGGIEPGAVPEPVGRTAYRVVQEALTNARRHAPGRPVTVVVGGRPGGELDVTVSNPSAPADPGPARPAMPGVGLVGLRERVELAGGRLESVASPDEFTLQVGLPWPG